AAADRRSTPRLDRLRVQLHALALSEGQKPESTGQDSEEPKTEDRRRSIPPFPPCCIRPPCLSVQLRPLSSGPALRPSLSIPGNAFAGNRPPACPSTTRPRRRHRASGRGSGRSAHGGTRSRGLVGDTRVASGSVPEGEVESGDRDQTGSRHL